MVLFVLSFSPLVLSPGEPSPTLFGVPRTLWMGILTYLGLVACTYVGTRVHPDEQAGNGSEG